MTKPWWTRAMLGRTAVTNPLEDDESCDPQFETQWRPLIKKRVFAILASLALWVVSLEGRLIWIQVVSHERWTELADRQQLDTEVIEAPRGSIRDRNGRLLAYSILSYDLYLNPRYVNPKKENDAKVGVAFKSDPKVFVDRLCKALGDCEPGEQASMLAKLEKPKGSVLIRRAKQMSSEAVAGVRALTKDLGKYQPFIQLQPNQVRFYP